MTDRFPLAFSTLGCPNWTLEQAAAQAEQNGYQALEVRLLDGEIIPVDLPPQRRVEIKRALARHQIKIVGLGLSTRFSSPDAEERRSNLELLHRYLELANDLSVPMVRTFGGNVADGQTLEDAIDRVAASLAEAAPAAEKLGVNIVLETHDAFCRGADVARVLAQVPAASVGAVWDVHHPFRMGESIEETWRQIGERVKNMFISRMRAAAPTAHGNWCSWAKGKCRVML